MIDAWITSVEIAGAQLEHGSVAIDLHEPFRPVALVFDAFGMGDVVELWRADEVFAEHLSRLRTISGSSAFAAVGSNVDRA